MKRDDIDIVLSFKVELRPIRRLESVTEELALKQEEMRLSYYMDKLKDIVERKIRAGELILIEEY